MYLKRLEMLGFKSFAERTVLEFPPGLTAIVGPNGCGKSNIADAVRWVLGEQSAKALRGSRMEDVIFNGTDFHKPMGMAEVSLVFADCESVLGTEYNEVTITRRVFRDGEGSYFINKVPCRLKDIQRLFLGTGIGTDGYSVLEQGRIDQVLSSRPEDRREIFEEASGITKYKADKKEAIRKLEQTEANLTRLADIIREVRRQIISLQRQAGKARRYKALQEQLRSLDLFLARERWEMLDREISELETRRASLVEQEEAALAQVQAAEQQVEANRARLSEAEQAIARAGEALLRAKADLERTRELIRVNEDRIRELRALAERDEHDRAEAQERHAQHTAALAALEREMEQAIASRDQAEAEWRQRAAELAEFEQRIAALQKRNRELSDLTVDAESRVLRIQNALQNLDAAERAAAIRRERLAAEKAQLEHTLQLYEKRRAEMRRTLEERIAEVRAREAKLNERRAEADSLRNTIQEISAKLSELRAEEAALTARLEMLASAEAVQSRLPAGAQFLLRETEEKKLDLGILGALVSQIDADPEYQLAVESALRSELEALVVRDAATALNLLAMLCQNGAGSAQLVPNVAPEEEVSSDAPGEPLLAHLRYPAEWAGAVRRLLENVRVVNELPTPDAQVPPGVTWVTPHGHVRRANGVYEIWRPEPETGLRLGSRRETWEKQQRLCQETLAALSIEWQNQRRALDAVENEITLLSQALDEARHKVAQCEGEQRIVDEEAEQARQRAETVAWEWQTLKDQVSSDSQQRVALAADLEAARAQQQELRTALAALAEELHILERERAARGEAVTESRIRYLERRQAAEALSEQQGALRSRIAEIEALLRSRAEALENYQNRVRELTAERDAAFAQLAPLSEALERCEKAVAEARVARQTALEESHRVEAAAREARNALEEIRARKGQLEVALAEQRIRRQNLLDRVAAEYHVTLEQLRSAPEPEWPDGVRPDRETLENQCAELRAKLEAMGPINLVAIEEYEQLEQRLAFLTQQQDDLVKAKQQLLGLIRRINQTTTEMFSRTFEQVNRTFQEMFQRLFGGGTAKLVLVDEGDVLESGIEIIARPPGKKLQSISLLSGGERTMTAVALLFALYLVKPSPFCLLDELDAALDEANIGRFVKVVQGFLDRSQFILITHNRQTISAANTIYGVTMERQGISTVMSLRLSDVPGQPA